MKKGVDNGALPMIQCNRGQGQRPRKGGEKAIAKKPNAHAIWQKNNTKSITIRLMSRTESDIINKLDSVPNKAGYIKALIRADIAKDDNA